MAKRPLKPKPLYGVDKLDDPNQPNTYIVTKMDEDYNVLHDEANQPIKYKVYIPPTGVMRGEQCDCFAGLMGKDCRHKKIAKLFIERGLVGKPGAYNFDRNYWV